MPEAPAVPRLKTHDPFHHAAQHRQQSGRMLRQFLHPNGCRIYVASSPEEIDTLRRTTPKEEGAGTEYVLANSVEHMDALRQIYTFHEDLRKDLRQKHPQLYDEIEAIVQQINTLSTELHLISGHAIQLEANFSKYGYSATIRTRENADEFSDASSYSTSPRTKEDWDAERGRTESLKLWVAPVVRQYVHKGLLWRASETQEVASYELFVDLLYVGIVAISGDATAEEATGTALLRFAITFTQAWKYWIDLASYMAWFDADDVARRASVLFILASLLGFTVNMVGFFGQTYTSLIAFYLTGRLFTVMILFWYAYLLPMIQAHLLCQGLVNIVSVGIWIGSIHIEGKGRQILIWIALFFDIFGTSLIPVVTNILKSLPKFGQWFGRNFEFIPAVSIEHRIERTGSFVTLVFGYSIVGLLYQNSSSMGLNAYFGKAVLGLIQAFAFNTIYFEADMFNIHVHAIRRHFLSAVVWLGIHLPFMMSFVIAGAALSRLVLTHDCSGTDPHTLMAQYAEKSSKEINPGVRWFYCAGLGISLLCTGIISLSHSYKRSAALPNSKSFRQALRLTISLIIIFLGFATSLNSLELISTTTTLIFFIVIFEIACDIVCDCGDHRSIRDVIPRFVKRSRKCQYNARGHLARGKVENSIRNGQVIKIEDLKDDEKAGFDPG